MRSSPASYSASLITISCDVERRSRSAFDRQLKGNRRGNVLGEVRVHIGEAGVREDVADRLRREISRAIGGERTGEVVVDPPLIERGVRVEADGHQRPVRSKNASSLARECRGIGEMMQRIDAEHPVDACRRERELLGARVNEQRASVRIDGATRSISHDASIPMIGSHAAPRCRRANVRFRIPISATSGCFASPRNSWSAARIPSNRFRS